MRGIMKYGLTGALAVLLLTSGSAWAACRWKSGAPAVDRNIIIPLNTTEHRNITVSTNPSLARYDYTPIFKINMRNSNFPTEYIFCDTQYAYMVYEITNAPYGLLVGAQGFNEFATNMDNISVKFDGEYKNTKVVRRKIGSTVQNETYYQFSDTEFSLGTTIRSGGNNVADNHGVIEGSSLPSGRQYITEDPGGAYDDSALTIGSFSFSGEIILKNPTCNVENKTVYLGEISNVFSGIESSSPWVDSSINVTCDSGFMGVSTSNREDFNFDTIENKWISTGVVEGAKGDNRGLVTIKPVYGFIEDHANDSGEDRDVEWKQYGVFSLENISEESAEGIGIQLASSDQITSLYDGLSYDSNSDSFLTRFSVTPGTNSFRIPLYARYIQTKPTYSFGRGDSKVVYTVRYK
ncbi:TPA: hypothetical protein R1887_005198 [Klebsiella oxytoca]|nr:hypothetical protein [Klebsiella oxytoca]